MCISVLSTAHPEYPFILISNRDEVISRPTARVDWWDSPHQGVLGGRDLQREERGTWLGITRQGRIAILTNFRDEGVEVNRDKSRGGITTSYLAVPPDTQEEEKDFVERLMREVGIFDVGGFTLLFGKLRAPSRDTASSRTASMPGLAVVSNRTKSAESLTRLATSTGETHGLSNSHYGDTSWPKVVHGEALLREAIQANVDRNDSQAQLVDSLFEILNVDDIPRRRVGEDRDTYIRHMRNSILIPAAKGEAVESRSRDDLASAREDASVDVAHVELGPNAYGTQKQTVILVNQNGQVTFIERTLYDDNGGPLAANERDRTIEFEIEGWNEYRGAQRRYEARL